jgi:phosphomannomutase
MMRYMDIHIDEVLNLPFVDVAAVKAAQFRLLL